MINLQMKAPHEMIAYLASTFDAAIAFSLRAALERAPHQIVYPVIKHNSVECRCRQGELRGDGLEARWNQSCRPPQVVDRLRSTVEHTVGVR